MLNPDTLTRSQRIRVWIGNFVVDYIETFTGLLPAQLVAILLMPAFHFDSFAAATVAAYQWSLQLLGPAAAALVSAGRRSLVNAWPALRKFFASGFGAVKDTP